MTLTTGNDARLGDDELIALADTLGRASRAAQFAMRGGPPLIDTPYAQPIPDGVANPLWEIVRRLPTEARWHGQGPGDPSGDWAAFLPDAQRKRAYTAGLGRMELCARYAWGIPTPGDITWLSGVLDGRGVVEIGAGSGYWAWQLTQAGIDVLAYDPHPPRPDNRYNQHRLYHPVQLGGHEQAAEHPERALVLCWPSCGDSFAEQTLHLYRGDTVIYCGEGEGGCCADEGFFRVLRRDFDEAHTCAWHVSYWGIHDTLSVWRRKDADAPRDDEEVAP